MGHSSLLDVRGGLPDAQDTEMFDWVIPDVPGAEGFGGRDLAVLCQTAEWPGRSSETLEVQLHGTQVNFAGKANMPRTLSATYAENAGLEVTNTFQRWFEYQRGTISGTAADYKSGYSIDGAVLIKYDVTGAVADQAVFYGLIVEDMPNVSLDGSNTALYVVNITFRYDFYRTRNVTLR